MTWLPVDVPIGTGFRAEELVTAAQGRGVLNGAGTGRAGALKDNCCHGCLRDEPFGCRSGDVCSAEGRADLSGTVSGSFQLNPRDVDSQVFLHLNQPHPARSTHGSVIRSRCDVLGHIRWSA